MMNYKKEGELREKARKLLKEYEPLPKVKGFMFSKEKANSIEKSFLCEKHGEFETRFSNLSGKVIVNTTCSKCIKDFDLMLEQKEKELKKEQELIIKDINFKKRLEKLKSLGVSKRYIDNSFDNYTAETPEKDNALVKCKELCHSIISEGSSCNLIMVGGVGTGKTHLANSMVIELFDNKKKAQRINLINLIRSLKSTWSKDNDQTEAELINYFTSIDLLIIDEVGIQFDSDTEKLFIFDIINGRYENCLPTVIASNLDIAGVKKILGDRCVDRLRQDGGKVIAFNWGSYR